MTDSIQISNKSRSSSSKSEFVLPSLLLWWFTQVAILFSYFLYLAIAVSLIPGKIVPGALLSDGSRLHYRCNGQFFQPISLFMFLHWFFFFFIPIWLMHFSCKWNGAVLATFGYLQVLGVFAQYLCFFFWVETIGEWCSGTVHAILHSGVILFWTVGCRFDAMQRFSVAKKASWLDIPRTSDLEFRFSKRETQIPRAHHYNPISLITINYDIFLSLITHFTIFF